MTIGKHGSDPCDDQPEGVPGRADEPSPLRFRLDPGSGVPTYLQLVQQVEQAARLGFLKVGDKLPRVKDAVADLAINPNTVLKAYRELEYRGIAAGKPGQGTFVQAVPALTTLREITELRRSLLGWIALAADSGLDDEAMSALFAASLRQYRDNAAHGAA
ncbi:MAG: GntR family transcriptional regulator [Streptosporangiaceae bacterium]|nr:GntR family transcriptional regulator [Streptosporangiaceae bacterium]